MWFPWLVLNIRHYTIIRAHRLVGEVMSTWKPYIVFTEKHNYGLLLMFVFLCAFLCPSSFICRYHPWYLRMMAEVAERENVEEDNPGSISIVFKISIKTWTSDELFKWTFKLNAHYNNVLYCLNVKCVYRKNMLLMPICVMWWFICIKKKRKKRTQQIEVVIVENQVYWLYDSLYT